MVTILQQLKELDARLNGGHFSVNAAVSPLDKLRALEDRFDARELNAFHVAKQLEACFDHSMSGMCLVALDGRFLKVNPKICEIWERTASELLKLRWQDITHPDDIEVDEGGVQNTTSTDSSGYTLLKRYIMPSGEEKKCLLKVVLIEDPITNAPMYFVSQVTVLAEILDIAEKYHAGDFIDE